MRESTQYQKIKSLIRPGDLIAFGGYSLFSRWAKLTTSSNVTHVATVTACTHCEVTNELLYHQVFESTVRDKKRGVMVNILAERIEEYDGDVWWLPLRDDARAQFVEASSQMKTFIASEVNKAYDIWQLFGSTVDFLDNHRWLWRLTRNIKDEKAWFCSELIAELYNRTGIVKNVDAAETTPIDLCRFSIFAGKYYQLKGEPKRIRRFNSLLSENWGQWLAEDDHTPEETR